MNEQIPIYVIIPVYAGAHKFQIIKKSPWGVLDHFILSHLAKTPSSLTKLSYDSNLPSQIILQIIIPFMKLGWVEIIQNKKEYLLRCTPLGMVITDYDELPTIYEPYFSIRSFIIDPVTGGCYRSSKKQKGFETFYETRLKDVLSSKQNVIKLKVNNQFFEPHLSDIYSCIAEKDEKILGFESRLQEKPYRENRRYLLAKVDEFNTISGIPENISQELSTNILELVNKHRDYLKVTQNIRTEPQKTTPKSYQVNALRKNFCTHTLSENQMFLVIGGKKHFEHLKDMILNASSRLIIHSTFIHFDTELFKDILEMLKNAAKRTVKVDILWGQGQPSEPSDKFSKYKSALEKIEKINLEFEQEGLSSLIRLHIDSTDSHIKFLYADHNKKGDCVTLGSCNWLASSFNRFEVSTCFVNTSIIKDVIDIASVLVNCKNRVSTALSKDLASLANSIGEKHRYQNIEHRDSSSAKVVLKSEHDIYVRQARDKAKKKVFICSHRINHNVYRPIITPIKTLIETKPDIAVNVYYGLPSDGMKNKDVKNISSDTTKEKLVFKKLESPELIHAKILLWDEKDIIVSSLNWLSASQATTYIEDEYDEIGIHISSAVIVNKFREAFKEIYNIDI
ncbi:phospholipase D-like domain-containing protein [Gilliamella apicola]|uniref:phospholipase D-like domain-containing protein n=1 Tax=Gilliamella apicola TaxID=1196095 RepID=UPI002FEE5C33